MINDNTTAGLLIVVPTLNSFHLLPRLYTSLQCQTWSDWRLLFIDGPSSAAHRRWLDHCCGHDSRCDWIEQSRDDSGIFGAMNQGFSMARSTDWILFWGSDDLAATTDALAAVMSKASRQADLVICQGRYLDAATGQLARRSIFSQPCVLDSKAFRSALRWGSTPPHQATLFGPGARRRLSHYSAGFRLSADLDYFLQLSSFSDLTVQCLDIELVHMDNAGVSGKQTRRRLAEVHRAYSRAFGRLWFLSFLSRYFHRILSLFRPFS